MHITLNLDTGQLTAEDRRVLMALAGHDAGELRITRLDGPDVQKQDVAPPLPVPVPAAFAARLGQAVQQFGPRGSGTEARLPYAEQAGVRTSSTMPDDDASEFEAEIMAAAQTPLPDGPHAHPQVPDADAGEGLAHTRWGRPEDRAPEPSDEPEHDAIIRARGGITVPRSLVEEQPPPDPGALVREAVLRQPLTAPVRHTSP